MKIVQNVILLNRGNFAGSKAWAAIRQQIHSAISQAEWPVGSGTFTIHPECGRKSGKGNGVVPIKSKSMLALKNGGWQLEYPWNIGGKQVGLNGKGSRAGNIDAAKVFPEGLVVVEWETGNISSSHRAINKMALGLITKACIAGVLVVPDMKLAQYLTDRIGNIQELIPYYPVWNNLAVTDGVLEIVVIEQDFEDINVEKISKGNDGNSRAAKAAILMQKKKATKLAADAEKKKKAKLAANAKKKAAKVAADAKKKAAKVAVDAKKKAAKVAVDAKKKAAKLAATV
jgi:hypothetical protein